MRTEKQYKRDTYYLNLGKAVSIAIMIAYGFYNETLTAALGEPLALIAVLFMLIPRSFINELFDQDIDGGREIKNLSSPSTLKLILNVIKFVCLVILTLYALLNNQMIEAFGRFPLWIASGFMVIPRKLIVGYDEN